MSSSESSDETPKRERGKKRVQKDEISSEQSDSDAEDKQDATKDSDDEGPSDKGKGTKAAKKPRIETVVSFDGEVKFTQACIICK